MFSAIFAKRNSFGHAYVASLNLAQHEIYSYVKQLLSFNALN